MPQAPELHLVVPGICGPLAETQSLRSSKALDQWVRTLAQSSSKPSAGTLGGVLAEILDLSINGDFPSAALTLLANAGYDTDKYYMHADPVHLQADLDHAVLTSYADLDISDDEATVLIEMLNQHFNQDGLEFFAINKDQWFVSSDDRIDMITVPLVEATGRNVNFLLPRGVGSARWKQILTEAQMLMHSHEVNMAREKTGRLSINSLWFHGSGDLSKLNSSGVNTICSKDDMFKGLASHIKCDYSKVPDTVNEYADFLLSSKPGSKNVLHISELEHLVNYTDVSMWLKKLSEILDCWLYPLLKITYKNNIKMTLYPCDGKSYQFSKYEFLKLWRHGWRKRQLEKYVSSY